MARLSMSIESRGAVLPPEVEARDTLPQASGRFAVSKLLATIAVGASLLAGGEAAQAKNLPAPKGGPAGQVGMSDEFTETHWAYAANNSPVRSRPSAHSKARFPLRLSAEDGSPEVYVVRSLWHAPNGSDWARIRIPARPKPLEGWVDRSALGRFGVSHDAIRINRESERLTLYKNGRPVLRTPVGVGAPGTPTPAGHFWVRERFHVPKNTNFLLNGRSIPYSVYGPDIIMTTAYSSIVDNWPGGGMIGIHGTDQPGLIPGRPSHGCVRVHNEQIRRIYPEAPTGTPIDIV
jgi:lipoprotein-anchoring transpeptidase ErfK/SrfK